MSDPLEPFEQRLREWALRPSRSSPREVALRVVERIARPSPPGLRPLAWAAAALVLAAGLWLTLGSRAPTPPRPAVAPPQPDNVVQFWLDPETPVYFVIGPARPEGEAP